MTPVETAMGSLQASKHAGQTPEDFGGNWSPFGCGFGRHRAKFGGTEGIEAVCCAMEAGDL